MANAIVEGRPHQCSGRFALHALAVMLGIIESAESGDAVEIGVPGAALPALTEKASHVPFTLLINEEFAQSGEGVDLSSEDFIGQLWLLALTLVLIMVSGENLLEPGKLLKTVEAKEGFVEEGETHSGFTLGLSPRGRTSDQPSQG
jgi:hypothetical protein